MKPVYLVLGSKVCKTGGGSVRHWQIFIFACDCSHDFPTHIKVRLHGKRFGESKRRICKSSGDQVGFLRTTRLGPKAGMQHLMALLIPSVLYPGVPHDVQ